MKKVRIGIIGTGLIARAHANAIQTCFRDCEITALCDLIPEKMEQYAADFKLSAKMFTDYRDLIDSGLVDMVSVTTSNDFHKEITIYAAGKKLPVLCEKPLGLDAREVEEMAQACEENGILNLTGFTYRRIPAMIKIKEMIDQGVLGRIYHYKGRFYADRLANPDHPLEWRHLEEKAGSSVLGDLASHTLDMALYLLSSQCKTIKSVYANSEIFVPYRKDPVTGEQVKVTCDDSCNILAKFEDGTDVCLENSRYSPFEMEIHISGEKGSIKYNLSKHDEFELMLYDSPADYFKTFQTVAVKTPGTPIHPEANDRMARQYTYFIDCLNQQEAAHPTIRETVYIQQLLDAMKKSYQTEQLIKL